MGVIAAEEGLAERECCALLRGHAHAVGTVCGSGRGLLDAEPAAGEAGAGAISKEAQVVVSPDERICDRELRALLHIDAAPELAVRRAREGASNHGAGKVEPGASACDEEAHVSVVGNPEVAQVGGGAALNGEAAPPQPVCFGGTRANDKQAVAGDGGLGCVCDDAMLKVGADGEIAEGQMRTKQHREPRAEESVAERSTGGFDGGRVEVEGCLLGGNDPVLSVSQQERLGERGAAAELNGYPAAVVACDGAGLRIGNEEL